MKNPLTSGHFFRQIKEDDFKRWRYEAMQKRDACSRGDITLIELTEWM